MGAGELMSAFNQQTVKTKLGICHLDDFPSIQALAGEIESANLKARIKDKSFTDDLPEALKRCRTGREDWAERAAKYMRKHEALLQTKARVWSPSVQGAYPMVPDYLAGMPECMRMSEQVMSDTSLLRIFACSTVSADLSREKLEARGAAILALVQLLGAVRPIELYTYCDLDGDHGDSAVFTRCRIETAPLDMATACYALISSGFSRQINFTWAAKYGYRGSWGWDHSPDDRRKVTCQALGAAETDLVIHGGHSDNKMIREPDAWLKDQLDKHAQVAELA